MLNLMSMDEMFDYAGAVAELERIAAKVEDPATGIDDIELYIRRSDELIKACRSYLRGTRGRLESLAGEF